MTVEDLGAYITQIERKKQGTSKLVGLSKLHTEFRDEKISEKLLSTDTILVAIDKDVSSVDSLLVKERIGKLQREWCFLRRRAEKIIGGPIGQDSILILDELDAFIKNLKDIFSAFKVFLNNNKESKSLEDLERVLIEIFVLVKPGVSFDVVFGPSFREKVSTEQDRVILVYNI